MKKENQENKLGRGRPGMYSEALADKICNLISTSTKGLYLICKDHDDLPSAVTIYDWLQKKPDFANKYARAREMQADLMAGEMLEIADDSSNDTMKMVSKSGEQIEVENKEWVNRSRLRVDTRKWLASKLAPKKYGEKIEQTITGDLNMTVSQTQFSLKVKK